jgi:hypothetical protein
LYTLRPNSDTETPLNFSYNDIEIAFASKLQQYWYSFIINGDPNNYTGVHVNGSAIQAAPAVRWPEYQSSSDLTIRLGYNDGSINVVDNSTIWVESGLYKTICGM